MRAFLYLLASLDPFLVTGCRFWGDLFSILMSGGILICARIRLASSEFCLSLLSSSWCSVCISSTSSAVLETSSFPGKHWNPLRRLKVKSASVLLCFMRQVSSTLNVCCTWDHLVLNVSWCRYWVGSWASSILAWGRRVPGFWGLYSCMLQLPSLICPLTWFSWPSLGVWMMAHDTKIWLWSACLSEGLLFLI